MTTISSDVYGRPASLMTFDFKQVKDDIFSDELQRMMTVRREANFYDVSPEITMEAMKIAKDMDFMPPSIPVPPSPRGYMRMSINDGMPLVWKGMPRFNGVLWDHDTIYMVHDSGGQSPLRMAPVRIALGYKPGPGAVKLDPLRDDENLPPHRHVGLTVLGPDISREAIEMVRTAMEEMIAMCHVVFDMLAEIKATTVERQQMRNPFGSKHREYFEVTRVVRVRLHQCRKKYLKEHHEKTGRTNAWHEVRSHFRHRRVTKPDCQHAWTPRFADDDGKHYKCSACGEIKTRVEFPNGAGDRSKGVIKHVYEVTG